MKIHYLFSRLWFLKLYILFPYIQINLTLLILIYAKNHRFILIWYRPLKSLIETFVLVLVTSKYLKKHTIFFYFRPYPGVEKKVLFRLFKAIYPKKLNLFLKKWLMPKNKVLFIIAWALLTTLVDFMTEIINI